MKKCFLRKPFFGGLPKERLSLFRLLWHCLLKNHVITMWQYPPEPLAGKGQKDLQWLCYHSQPKMSDCRISEKYNYTLAMGYFCRCFWLINVILVLSCQLATWQPSFLSMAFAHDYIGPQTNTIIPRRWDWGLSPLVLGDSNCWRGSNKYSGRLTQSIYLTLSLTKTCCFQSFCVLTFLNK